MAFPAIPTLEQKKKVHIVVKSGSTVLGQIRSFTLDETISVSEEDRISDNTTYRSRDDKDVNLSFVVYIQNSMKEWAIFMGGSTLPGSGGWLGSEVLKLDTASAVQNFTLELYDVTTGSGAVQGIWTVTGWNAISQSIPVGGAGSTVATINGTATACTYTPSAGVGA